MWTERGHETSGAKTESTPVAVGPDGRDTPQHREPLSPRRPPESLSGVTVRFVVGGRRVGRFGGVLDRLGDCVELPADVDQSRFERGVLLARFALGGGFLLVSGRRGWYSLP